MKILGVHDGHNASAALIIDGVVTGAIQEERLSRTKNHTGCPHQAINYLLAAAHLQPSDLDQIALAGQFLSIPETREGLLAEFRATREFSDQKARAAQALPSPSDNLRRRVENLQALGLSAGRIHAVEHHTCHAAYAYHGSNLPAAGNVLVLTCDGGGDNLCATVNLGWRGRIERIASVDHNDSVGMVYALVTFLLGMVPLEHEYKLMGLAPYASNTPESRAVFEGLTEFVGEGVTWRRKSGVPTFFAALGYLEDRLRYRRFDQIAGALQSWLEEFLVTWLLNCIKKTGISRVAVSGGVFMNAKANGLLSQLKEVEDLYVAPSCGDESNSIGAAWQLAAESGEAIQALDNIYLGPPLCAAELCESLSYAASRGLRIQDHGPDICNALADLLVRGEIVATCSERMEFGARALGNRSILADPCREDVVSFINKAVKRRDFWMPFACSILAERADSYLPDSKALVSPYMMLCFDASLSFSELKGGCHPYDHSTRPQIVRPEDNPRFHRLLKAFETRTGRGALINTSFNIHGHPIVLNARHAVDALLNSELKFLALESHLLMKS